MDKTSDATNPSDLFTGTRNSRMRGCLLPIQAVQSPSVLSPELESIVSHFWIVTLVGQVTHHLSPVIFCMPGVGGG